MYQNPFIQYNIPMDKLKYYGINGIAHNLLKIYLSNRKQYIQFGNIKSEEVYITTDVPQESMLGPLLLSMYINNLSIANDLFNSITYAELKMQP